MNKREVRELVKATSGYVTPLDELEFKPGGIIKVNEAPKVERWGRSIAYMGGQGGGRTLPSAAAALVEAQRELNKAMNEAMDWYMLQGYQMAGLSSIQVGVTYREETPVPDADELLAAYRGERA